MTDLGQVSMFWASPMANTHLDGLVFCESFGSACKLLKGRSRLVALLEEMPLRLLIRRVKSPALETTPGWKTPVAGNDLALEKTWRWKMPRTILTSLWLETSPVLEAAFVWTKPLAGTNPWPERTLGWKEPNAGNSPWAGKSP